MYTPQPQVGSVYYSGIVVRGQGFGEPGPNSFIKIKRHVYGAYWRKVDSTAALVWKDDLIVVSHGYQVKGGEVRVFTPDGTSAIASITQAYEYTSVPTLLDGGHYPFPLALTVGVGSQVWVNSEFHRDLFQMLTPSGTMTLSSSFPRHGCEPDSTFTLRPLIRLETIGSRMDSSCPPRRRFRHSWGTWCTTGVRS
jgi:hypothetical protein